MYHPGNWRKRIGYGTGTLGDMGCHILDGVQGLAYARSRHFETLNEVTGCCRRRAPGVRFPRPGPG